MAITAVTKIKKVIDTDKFIAESTKKIAVPTTKEKSSEASAAHPLLSAIGKTCTSKRTENGARALSTTSNPLLDFFGVSGALRTRSESDIFNLFMKAFAYDEAHAMKALFYTRDIRGGQGERRTFRAILTHLAYSHPEAVIRNLELIPEYGRFDDLYALVETPLEDLVFGFIANQWNKDATALEHKRYADVSLMAKWLKSENASSRETRRLGALTAKKLGLTSKQYRQSLTAFRTVINIVETAMSANNWTTIDYSKLPSLAHKKYRAAFARHDATGYTKYLDSVKKGELKINAAALYPYDLVCTYTEDGMWGARKSLDETIEAQWKALPDYLSGDDSFLVMVDTSGSMFPRAINSSVGLGIYFGDHAKGPFAHHFLTFTDHPHLVELPHSPNSTLLDKVTCVLNRKHVGFSTNLEAAFNAVLDSAVNNKIAASDMPRAILVISDMEINQIGDRRATTFTAAMKKKFAAAGYEMPTLVYWNVEARQDTFHATVDDKVRFVSGQSPSIFKALCEDVESFDAVSMMLKVLDDERYAKVC